MKYNGTIYLIHFAEKFKHVQHYIGWTTNLDGRFERHTNGRGSRLLQFVSAAGISFEVVRTWKGDRKFERKLKKQKQGPRLCPVCSAKNFLSQKQGNSPTHASGN